MALVGITCKKCGESTKLDIGDMSKEEVIKLLSNDKDGFHCFGHHVEFGNRIDYWTIDWSSIEEGHAPTEEEFLAKLKSKYNRVLTTSEIDTFYIPQGFSYGVMMAIDKSNNKEVAIDYVMSPRGTRYYYTNV